MRVGMKGKAVRCGVGRGRCRWCCCAPSSVACMQCVDVDLTSAVLGSPAVSALCCALQTRLVSTMAKGEYEQRVATKETSSPPPSRPVATREALIPFRPCEMQRCHT